MPTAIALPARDPSTYSDAETLEAAGRLDDLIDGLDEDEAEALLYDWRFWRRPAQTPPTGRWRVWFIRAGRGAGKTRSGAETTRERVERGLASRVGIVAPTAGDARDVMIEGESGLLAVHPPHSTPKYEPSKRRLTWPNGAIGHVYSAEEPDRLRGPQHDWVWGDEPASKTWSEETFDNIMLGLRLGRDPRMMLTGTPKPRPWLRRVSARDDTVITTGSTYENVAYLAESFIADILGRYEHTRLGRQEIHAEWLDDVEGALWVEATIETNRMVSPAFDRADPARSMREWLMLVRQQIVAADRRRWRTIVAVDPPGETAEAGIIVGTAPVHGRQGFDHCIIVDDMSIAGPPETWGAQAVSAFKRHGAEAIWVESNQGGDMVRSTIHAVDPSVPVKKITARESKSARAEPIAALYERGWVHHAAFFPMLESQMVTWVPDEGKSPDRVDALVHCVRTLLTDTGIAPATVMSPLR